MLLRNVIVMAIAAGGPMGVLPSAPPEGMPGVGDAKIYRGTLDLLATGIATRFYSHPSGK